MFPIYMSNLKHKQMLPQAVLTGPLLYLKTLAGQSSGSVFPEPTSKSLPQDTSLVSLGLSVSWGRTARSTCPSVQAPRLVPFIETKLVWQGGVGDPREEAMVLRSKVENNDVTTMDTIELTLWHSLGMLLSRKDRSGLDSFWKREGPPQSSLL